MTTTDSTIELPATATYAQRVATWTPTAPGEGLLLVSQRRTANGKEESDLYAVEEQHPPSPGVREFLLLNVYDERQPDVYRVLLTPRSAHCTCTAGRVKRIVSCKHADSMLAFVATDAITPLEDVP